MARVYDHQIFNGAITASGEHVIPAELIRGVEALLATLTVTEVAGSSPTLDVVLKAKDPATDDTWFALATWSQKTGATAIDKKWVGHPADTIFPTENMKVVWTLGGTSVAAALSTTMTGTNNDLDITAATAGAVGNDITFAIVATGEDAKALSIAVLGSAITVTPATDTRTKGSLTTTHSGGVNGRLALTAVDYGIGGNSITVAIVVAGNDTALSVPPVVGTAIIVNSATDSGGLATSTAAQVRTAILACATAAALVSVALPGTGALVVEAQGTTSLAGATTGVPATLTTNPAAGVNARVKLTSKKTGTLGHATTFAISAAAAEAQALAVGVVGTAITATPATDSGALAALTTTAAAGVNGRITLTSKVAGAAGNGVGITILAGDINQGAELVVKDSLLRQGSHIYFRPARGASAITTTATLLKAAIEADPTADALVTVTLPGSGAGLVSAQAFTYLAGGGVGVAITSTAAQVKTAIDANVDAAALVDTSLPGTGATAVEAFTLAALSGGVAASITSTAAQVDTAVGASAPANALVGVANKAANDGTGIVTALAATHLAGGITVSVTAQIGAALRVKG